VLVVVVETEIDSCSMGADDSVATEIDWQTMCVLVMVKEESAWVLGTVHRRVENAPDAEVSFGSTQHDSCVVWYARKTMVLVLVVVVVVLGVKVVKVGVLIEQSKCHEDWTMTKGE
jgi:hypothetical protein